MKPILFNTEMVRAILDGRKTQTRRVVKWQRVHITDSNEKLLLKINPIKVGDIFYVRETWTRCFLDNKPMIVFKADENIQWKHENDGFKIPWIPSIHIPKDAARIFLHVKNIRVERLQDISHDDIYAEGLDWKDFECDNGQSENNVFIWWQQLWNLTAKDGYKWKDNPYVFVYEFERVEKPKDNQ